MYKIIGADQKEYGPITTEQVHQWIAEGRINAQTPAQATGETTWKPISTIPEFASSFAAAATPPPGPAPVPSSGNAAPSNSGRAAALDYISGPAIGLIVTGGLGIATALYGIVSHLTGMAIQQSQFQNLPHQNPEMLRLIQTFNGPAGIFLDLIGIAVAIFIIFAAIKMKKLESFGLAMTGTILAMIPCCSPCCCIGIPIGIWALVVLNKPEVKSYFS